MNIKNRIGKLEKTANPSGSFCICFRDFWIAQLDSAYDKAPLVEIPLPESDYCEKCQKPVNRVDTQVIDQLIEMYGVEAL